MTEKRHGKLPEHCCKTKLKLEKNLETNISGADCVNNICYINPKSKDYEWSIFHEMEHIRTAHEPYQTRSTGIVEYILERNIFVGNALNEALTEISVNALLNRVSASNCGYFKTVILAKQISAVLGFSDEQLLWFYKRGGRKVIAEAFSNLTGEQSQASRPFFMYTE